MGVTGDVSCWICEMMGEVAVRQLMRDDGWEEIRREQRYQEVMLAQSMNDGRE